MVLGQVLGYDKKGTSIVGVGWCMVLYGISDWTWASNHVSRLEDRFSWYKIRCGPVENMSLQKATSLWSPQFGGIDAYFQLMIQFSILNLDELWTRVSQIFCLLPFPGCQMIPKLGEPSPCQLLPFPVCTLLGLAFPQRNRPDFPGQNSRSNMPRQDIAQSSWHGYRRNRVITFHDSCLAVDSLFMYKVPFKFRATSFWLLG